jgi:hypothetical protein
MDKAVLVGINEYPYPNELRGCINDMNEMEAELRQALGFKEVLKLQDKDATAKNIKSALVEAVSGQEPGDRFLFWYSGHGAQLVDHDPNTDVICPVDFDFTNETSVTVNDFHGIFKEIKDGVIAIWGSDSCHSGDLEKDLRRLGVPKRFRRDPAKRQVAPRPSTFSGFRAIAAELPNIALISGCRSEQTSADAYIDGQYHGAFTYYFIETLHSPTGLTTPLKDLVPEVQDALSKAGYDQVPQLSGRPSCVNYGFLQPIAAPLLQRA